MTISFLVWGFWINELSLTLTPKKGKRKEKKILLETQIFGTQRVEKMLNLMLHVLSLKSM